MQTVKSSPSNLDQSRSIVQHIAIDGTTADELAIALKIDRPQATAAMIASDVAGLCKVRLLIFHDCSEKHTDSIEFGIGFPQLPWTCPHCGKAVENYDRLKFDIAAFPL